MQVPHRICTEVSETDHLKATKGGYRKDTERTVRTQGGGDHRGRMLSGPYPHVGSDTATSERSRVYGVSKE